MRTFRASCRSGVKQFAQLTVLACLLVLVGCSSTTFFYNRIDTLITWYVDDYVDLTREQDVAFAQELDVLHMWHRKEELPQYIVLLNDIDRALDDDLSQSDIDQLYTVFQAAAERLRQAATLFALDFGEQLSQEQRLEFIAAMREKQQAWYQERSEMDDDAYRDYLQDRFEDNFGEFLGRLDKGQKALIAGYVIDFLPMHEQWHDQRTYWVDELEQVLRAEPEEWREPASAVIESWDDRQTDAYLAIFQHNRDLSKRLTRDVVNSRTDKQNRRLRRSITGYREDFEALILVD